MARRRELIDNPDTWLAFTDLVFIDPVGTGWSRPAKPDGGSAFWGVQRDADVFAKLIALYVAKNSRGASPKYLLGESYGGFRAAKVARALQSDQGIVVTGIMMVSPHAGSGVPMGRSNPRSAPRCISRRWSQASWSGRRPSRPKRWPRPSASP